MIRFQSLFFRAICCVAMHAGVASSQGLRSPTFDLGAQIWTGGAEGALFSHRGGFALDAIAAVRHKELSRGAVVVGTGVAIQSIPLVDDICVMSQPPTVGAGCAPKFPSFTSLSILAGVEGRFGPTARVVGGPAVFHAGARGMAAGLQARADLSSPPLFHLSLVVSMRGGWIPNFEGREHRTGAAGVGLRIQ